MGYNSVKFIPEQTKYVAGFSESLRYVLSDIGLYHSRRKMVESTYAKGNSKQGNQDIFRLNSVHLLEYKIFKWVSYAMDLMGMGSNLLMVARKSG